MDRRGAFRGGFGSGSVWSSFDSRTSTCDYSDKWSRSSNWCCGSVRSRGCSGGPRKIGIGLRRITLDSDKPWTPVTKLGRLVKDGRVTSFEEIYRRSIPILEYQIVDLLMPNLKEQVLKILPVQKVVRTGLRTRFRALVAIGDSNGHVGLGVQCAKRVSTAIRRAIYRAKTAMIPVRRGYWRYTYGTPHTLPCQVVVRHSGVQVALYPAPRSTGVNAPPVIQKLLHLGGIQDCYTSATNYEATGPTAKATILALQRAYTFDPEKDKKAVEKDKADENSAFPELKSPLSCS